MCMNKTCEKHNITFMRLSLAVLFGIALCFAFTGTATAATTTGPTSLLSHYVSSPSSSEVLTWTGTGNPSDTYYVWQSTGGSVWVNLTSSGPISASTYTTSVIPYYNYYFIVTTSAVSNFPTGTSSSNTSNMSTAFPPDDNEHQYFAADTNLCADCHEAHTGVGPDLIKQQTVTDMCLFCHNGSGSKYDVLDGTVLGPDPSNPNGSPINYASPAGPFGDITTSQQTWTTSSSLVPVTSRHSLGSPLYQAPGGDNSATTSPTWNEPLGCGSCHQPHIQDVDLTQNLHTQLNYRNLQTGLPDATTTITVYGFDETNPATTSETVQYLSGINTFCGGCHTDFNTTGITTPGENKNGRYTQMYRHAIGVTPASFTDNGVNIPLTTTLPLEGDNPTANQNKIMCLTCHYAHGTTVQGVEDSSLPGNPSDTMLKRRDNMGVCEDCHKK